VSEAEERRFRKAFPDQRRQASRGLEWIILLILGISAVVGAIVGWLPLRDLCHGTTQQKLRTTSLPS
jgi:hypothetical protein